MTVAAALVAVTGATLTAVAVARSRLDDERRVAAAFERRVHERVVAVARDFDRVVAELGAVPGLYIASEEVTEPELARFLARVVSWPVGVRAVLVMEGAGAAPIREVWPRDARDEMEALLAAQRARVRAAIEDAQRHGAVTLFAVQRGHDASPIDFVFTACASSAAGAQPVPGSVAAPGPCLTSVAVVIDGARFAEHALGSFAERVVAVSLQVVESDGTLSPVVVRAPERDDAPVDAERLTASERIAVGASSVQIDLSAGAQLAEYHRTLRAPLWLAAGSFGTVLASLLAATLVSRSFRLSSLVEARTRELDVVQAARQRDAAELRDTEERFRILVEGARGHALVLLDAAGRVQSWNLAAERLFGWKESEILGRPATIFDDEAGTLGHTLDLARVQRHMFGEGTIVRSDRSTRQAEHVATALVHADGSLRGFALVSRDVTERFRQEQEIRRLNRELEDRVRERTAELESANRELEAFSYSVSHDLRAPLRAIDGFARILEEDVGTSLGADATRCVETIRRSARQMGTLIDDLLAFSRLTRQPLQRTTVDVVALVNDCWASLAQDREGRAIEFSVADLPRCRADAAMLKQAFGNLLANAIKFSRPRELAHVRVFADRAADGGAIYGVSDDGVGFDPAYADRLFGVFQRLHRQDEFEGTGVGLALVDRIVARHGGRVWAESEPGKGAIFRFTLGRSEA